jgi:hypothetical protein
VGNRVVCVWVHPRWSDDFTLYRMYAVSAYKVERDNHYLVWSDRGFPQYLCLGVGSYQVTDAGDTAAEFIEVDGEIAMHTSD